MVSTSFLVNIKDFFSTRALGSPTFTFPKILSLFVWFDNSISFLHSLGDLYHKSWFLIYSVLNGTIRNFEHLEMLQGLTCHRPIFPIATVASLTLLPDLSNSKVVISIQFGSGLFVPRFVSHGRNVKPLFPTDAYPFMDDIYYIMPIWLLYLKCMFVRNR